MCKIMTLLFLAAFKMASAITPEVIGMITGNALLAVAAIVAAVVGLFKLI